VQARLDLDFTPAYELIASLDAYLWNQPKNMDLGPDWWERTQSALTYEFAEALAEGFTTQSDPFLLHVLVSQCPEPRDVAHFLAWLGELTPGQLYERLVPYVPASAGIWLRDLGGFRDKYLPWLHAWHEQYFAALDPAILSALAADAACCRDAAAGQTTGDVLTARTGLVLQSAEVQRVLLIPQYHFRPMVRFGKYGSTFVVLYPAGDPHAVPGQPPTDLLRLTRALGDENRLRILHYLAEGEARSFTEIQKASGLAKNTVHHHLITLRAAGLIRVHLTGECHSERYTARRSTIDELGPRVQQFLDLR
jgi:DNA-binding transcriptional ArsR family regulator